MDKRIGRAYEIKRQGLIPSPRVGRSKGFACTSSECNYFNDATVNGPHNFLHDKMHVHGLPFWILRNKRSIDPEDDSVNSGSDNLELSKTLRSNTWYWDDKFDLNDFYQRETRQLIPSPRVGRNDDKFKNALITGLSEDDIDPIDLQLRAAFIPRIGKRSDGNLDENYAQTNNYFKHATAFVVPRFGRAAFTPRIGKRAAFTPRIGR